MSAKCYIVFPGSVWRSKKRFEFHRVMYVQGSQITTVSIASSWLGSLSDFVDQFVFISDS